MKNNQGITTRVSPAKFSRPLIKTLSALALLMLAAGCIPSLHPLYTAKDLIYDANLVGRWNDENNESWQFTAGDDGKSYHLVMRNENKLEGKFVAHLVKLGEERFLDLFPDTAPIEEMQDQEFYKMHLIPCHTFVRVDDIGKGLVMAALDPDWLEKLLKENPKALAHARTEAPDERLVLTATTEELQQFFKKHARTPGAFGDPVQFEKAKQSARKENPDAARKNG